MLFMRVCPVMACFVRNRILTCTVFNYHKIIKNPVCRLGLSTDNSVTPKRGRRSTREPDTKLLFFTHLLGRLSTNVAKKIIKDHPVLAATSLEDILRRCQSLEQLGIKKGDIAANISVLSLTLVNIKRRHASLSEIGLSSIGAPEIIRFDDFMKVSIPMLRKYNKVSCDEDQFKNLVLNLNCARELEEQIYSQCLPYEDVPVGVLRERIAVCLISFFLNVSTDRAKQVCKLSSLASGASLGNLKNLIVYLLEALNFDAETLNLYPELLRGILEDVKELHRMCDVYQLHLPDLLTTFPSVVLRSPEDIQLICKYLLDFGVPKENIQWSRVFLYHPSFVKDALDSLKSWPEIHVFKYNPKFIDLVLNYKTASLHLNYLKKGGFERFDVNDLLTPSDIFQKHLSLHKEKVSTQSIILYLAQMLDLECNEVDEVIRLHPWFTKASINSVRSNLRRLLNEHFTKEQILRGLPVVLYPSDRVIRGLKQLQTSPLSQPYDEWMSSLNVVQLLLYFIERDADNYLKPLPQSLPES